MSSCFPFPFLLNSSLVTVSLPLPQLGFSHSIRLERGNHNNTIISFKPCLCLVLNICFLFSSSDRFLFFLPPHTSCSTRKSWSWRVANRLDFARSSLSPKPNHGSYMQQIRGAFHAHSPLFLISFPNERIGFINQSFSMVSGLDSLSGLNC